MAAQMPATAALMVMVTAAASDRGQHPLAVRRDLTWARQQILDRGLVLGDDIDNNFAWKFELRNVMLSGDPDFLLITAGELWRRMRGSEPQVLFTSGVAGYPLMMALRHEAWQQDHRVLDCIYVRDQ